MSKLRPIQMANHVLVDTIESMEILPNWQPNWQPHWQPHWQIHMYLRSTKCEIPQQALAEPNLLASFLRSTPHLSEPSFGALYVANNPSYRFSRCDIALAYRLLQLLIRKRIGTFGQDVFSDKNTVSLQTVQATRSRSFLSSISKDSGLALASALCITKYVIFCTIHT